MNIHDIHHDRERKQNKTVYLTVLFEPFCCGVYVGSHKLFLISSIVIVIKRVCACHIALIYSDDLQCINISLQYRDLQTIGSFKNPTIFCWNVWLKSCWVPIRSCKASMHLPIAPPRSTANTNWAPIHGSPGFGKIATNGKAHNISYSQSKRSYIYNGKNNCIWYTIISIISIFNVEHIINTYRL